MFVSYRIIYQYSEFKQESRIKRLSFFLTIKSMQKLALNNLLFVLIPNHLPTCFPRWSNIFYRLLKHQAMLLH